MSPPPIALHHLGVGYDDVRVVRDVDLVVHSGEVVALLGANGSGKSTLVRGILGLAQVQAGTVELFGTPVTQRRNPVRSRIGYVPQQLTVGGGIPSTVEEVVSSGRLAQRPWYHRATHLDRTAVAGAIEVVGLTERRRATIGHLSGGQQRRALIARALAAEPDVLVMDEPTAGVDAEHQHALARTLVGLVERGITLLIVTHETAPLGGVVTRVVTMSGGRIVSDKPARGVVTRADVDGRTPETAT